MTSSRNELTLEDYTNIRRTVEAPFDERIKQLEVQRHQAIKAFNDAWPSMGGSAQHIARFEAEKEASSQSEDAADFRFHHYATSAFNGSAKRTVPMPIVREETHDVIDDSNVEVVTQTMIQDRLLARCPDANVQGLRVSISRHLRQLKDQGVLTLIEEGKAGAPNRYRVNKDVNRTEEAGLLE